MTWQQRLQPASFRGEAFFVEGASGQGGRRVAIHQYLNQSQHWAEDLGQSAASQRLQIFLIGADYDQARDRLFTALNKPGSGELVHPYLGTMRIQVKDYSWTISSNKGGYCKVDLNYVPAGERRYPQNQSRADQALQQAALASKQSLSEEFSARFDISNLPQYAIADIAAQVQASLDIILALQLELNISTELSASLNISTVAERMLQPVQLLASLQAQLAVSLSAGIDLSFSAYLKLQASIELDATARLQMPHTTVSLQRQSANQQTLQQTLQASTCIAMIEQLISQPAPFSTYDQAIEIRDSLLQQLDQQLLYGSDQSYSSITALQTTLVRYVDEVAPGLQRISQQRLQRPQPALALAYQLYGSTDRADDLMQRNRLSHPGFIPAGRDLEVLL